MYASDKSFKSFKNTKFHFISCVFKLLRTVIQLPFNSFQLNFFYNNQNETHFFLFSVNSLPTVLEILTYIHLAQYISSHFIYFKVSYPVSWF